MKRTHLKQKGFTLTELMIVVALAAIFATLAVPNMGGMIARQRVQGQAAEIANAFTFAHNEAVRRGKPVFVVPANIKSDGKLDGAATLNDGWEDAKANALLVFTDENKTGNTAQKYDSGEDLRVVSLNSQIKLVEISQEELGANVTKKQNKKMAIAYYSNGQMRIGEFNSGVVTVTEPSGAIGRIMLADKNRKTKNQSSRFCEVIRLDATGRASLYTDKRSKLTDDKQFFYCKYK